jgi:hypothetical protein
MKEYLALWWIQALVIAGGAALFLNGAPFLPKLRDIEPRRIEARWVGYMGTFVACMLWLAFGPYRPAWQAVMAYGIIWFVTLVVNTLVHLHNRDNRRDGGQIIKIGLTEKGEALLEEILRQEAPEEYGFDGLFRREQHRETAEERWENVMFPAMSLPGLIDEIMACIIKAMKEGNPVWLLPALANAQEVRQGVCRVRWNSLLWYRLFWPQHAR